MFKLIYYPVSVLVILLGFVCNNAQELKPGPVDSSHPIIQQFAAKETENLQTRNEFSFTRDADIVTFNDFGAINGRYHRVSDFVFDNQGERVEKITYFPVPSPDLQRRITNEDLDDLGGIQPFALEASKIQAYDFIYVGKEKIDEIDTYVFDVGPKVMPKKVSERFFKGRIWVDDRDLQIVKVKGKGVPEGEQRFPTFETYREQISDRQGYYYWFPTYTYADDVLVFPKGDTLHIRMIIKFSNYRRFMGRIKIVEDAPEPPVKPPVVPKKP